MEKIDGTGARFLSILSLYKFHNIFFSVCLQAIVESQQLRRETETIGPSAELAYWRRLFAQFSSIISHIKSPHTQSFIQLLTEAKSKLIKV